ncbi:hypothetical protein GCM10010390_87170 [Streptomyces mordarskii]|uniref:Transposase n=1 Tax=Streptomyces mordarskii TaxID=1226758 RepID=A0ABP3PMG1_9ACTN
MPWTLRRTTSRREAMTNTPPTVTDELSASLLDRLGPAALVELAVYIGFANFASRCNTAHGITSQGYSDACGIPLAGPRARAPHRAARAGFPGARWGAPPSERVATMVFSLCGCLFGMKTPPGPRM